LRFQSQPEVLTADTFGGRFAPPQYFSRWQAMDFFHTESLSATMPFSFTFEVRHRMAAFSVDPAPGRIYNQIKLNRPERIISFRHIDAL